MVLGPEDRGLEASWGASQRVKIPMRGTVDSLNVSVAAAVVLYEGLRQRS
jgi:TrmH family RNA methyltransferase